jgi:hypothetical protein
MDFFGGGGGVGEAGGCKKGTGIGMAGFRRSEALADYCTSGVRSTCAGHGCADVSDPARSRH